MNVAHLTKLAEIMDNVHATHQRFSLNEWAGVKLPDMTSVTTFLDDKEDIQHACGTTACACGYAAIDPYFQALGLNLVISGEVNKKRVKIEPTGAVEFNAALKRAKDEGWNFMDFDLGCGWGGVESIFDLTEDQAQYFFSENQYPAEATALVVAERIRHVIANGFPDYLDNDDSIED